MCVKFFGCKITASCSHKLKDGAKLVKKNDMSKKKVQNLRRWMLSRQMNETL